MSDLIAAVIGIDEERRELQIEKRGGSWRYKYRDEVDPLSIEVMRERALQGWAELAFAVFTPIGARKKILTMKGLYL